MTKDDTNKHLTIACENSVLFGKEAFGTLGEVVLFDGTRLCPRDISKADILIVRSTTKVDANLLKNSRIRFVGTATIGTDHLDITHLNHHNIHWCYAAGCNANSVCEYIITALFYLAAQCNFSLQGKTLGIIGVGHVGSRVAAKVGVLGIRTLLNDPPLERVLKQVPPTHHMSYPVGILGEQHLEFVTLNQLVAEADIISFHVPLTTSGVDPTFALADRQLFAEIKRGAILFNSSRGAIIDTQALISAIDKEIISYTAIDTWQGEPNISPDLLARVTLATPHIAGYSLDGKMAGTVSIYNKLCQFLGKMPTWDPSGLLPSPQNSNIAINAINQCEERVLQQIIAQAYDISADDKKLRQVMQSKQLPISVVFENTRRQHLRREYSAFKLDIQNGTPKIIKKVRDLGFYVL
jgi:erythronate-4-phosphate dehydrogenase